MPISDSVELDVSPALGSIADIKAALEDATSTFSAAITDAVSSIPPVLVQIEADSSTIGGSIDEALAAISPLVSVNADTSAIAGEIEAVGAEVVIDVPVTADTSEAQNSINELGQTAESSAGGISDLGSKADGLVASFGEAEAAGSSFSGVLSAISPEALGASAAIAAVGAATDKFFDAAVKVEAADIRFNQALGDTADKVEQIKVGDLSISLTDLADKLGSNEAQIKQSVATFAQLGNSSGASADRVAQASAQLVALAARAVALNPSLGSVSDVADRLGTALARGGRFASNFQLTLTAADIQQRALADSGKTAIDQLTIFDKAAAGAALATEKYGNQLTKSISDAGANPVITLRQLEEQFTKLAESLGGPIVAPVLDILKAVEPALLSIVKVVGSLAQLLVPAVQALVTVFSPFIDLIANTLSQAIGAFIPIVQLLAQDFIDFAPPVSLIQPLLEAFLHLVTSLAAPLQQLVVAFRPLIQAALTGATQGFQGLVLAIAAVVEVAAKLVDLSSQGIVPVLLSVGSALGLVDENSAAVHKSTGLVVGNVDALATDIPGLVSALHDLNDGFAKYLATQSAFSKDQGVADALRRTGISVADLHTELGGLDNGFKDFVSRAVAAGQVRISVGGADVTAAQIKGLNGTLSDYLNTSGAIVTQGGQLVSSFIDEASATDAKSEATFRVLALTQNLSDAQIAQIGVQAQAQFGVDSYTTRLEVMAGTAEHAAAAQTATAVSSQIVDAGFVALAASAAAGSINMDQLSKAAGAVGIDADTAAKFVDAAKKAIDTFVSNAIAKIPTVATEFDKLKDKTNPNDPQSLANNLNAATLGALTFQQNVDLIRQKFPEVAKLLQEKGPEAAGAFAATFLSSSDTVKSNLESAIKANKGAIGSIESDLRASIGGSASAARDLGQSVSNELGLGLDFSKVTTDQVNAAGFILSDAKVIDPLKALANTSGKGVGDELAAGIALGMGNGSPAIAQAARNAIDAAKKAAMDQGQIHSPSVVFDEIGRQLIAGLDRGFSSGAQGVIDQAESIVARAAEAASAARLNAAATAPPVGALVGVGAGSTSIANSFDVRLNVTAAPGVTAEEAQAQGAALGQGFLAQLPTEARIS